MRSTVLLVLVPLAAALVWHRNTIPLSGELVLTDVHAVYDASTDRVTALASGEAGVLLKLSVPAVNVSGAWTTLLDTSFPTYWYGCYLFDALNYLISGFIDGDDKAYGVVAFSSDGGAKFTNDTKIDPVTWGGGPIEFADTTEGYMPSTSGASAWRTQNGGRKATDWVEVTPSAGNWHAGNYVYSRDGYIAIAGSSDCASTNFGRNWSCTAPVDASGMDSALACGGKTCVVGGGEISPADAGWLHVSTDGGKTYNATRTLSASFPIRSTVVVHATDGHTTLIAAGGNVFSAVGGIYSSVDLGATWTLDVNLGQEVKACRALRLPHATRVFCVSAGAAGGSIVSADVL